MELSQELLSLLNTTALHLLAAGYAVQSTSWEQQKSTGVTIAVCCGALFAWADAVVRGSDMATAPHLRAFSGKFCPTMWVAAGEGGSDSMNAATTPLHGSPPLLALRHGILSYWDAVEGEDSERLWDWRGVTNIMTELEGEGATSLAAATKLALAVVGGSVVAGESTVDATVLAGATLLVSDWGSAPEMAVLRDMSVLAAIALHPALPAPHTTIGHWPDLAIMTPAWSVKQERAGVMFKIEALRGRGYGEGGKQVSLSPAAFNPPSASGWSTDVLVGCNYGNVHTFNTHKPGTAGYLSQYQCYVPGTRYYTEHHLLFGTPPLFAQQLGSDEAEMLMSTLLTPYLRLPIWLRFISEGRAAVLGNSAIRSVFTNICSEPGPWIPAAPTKIPDAVPAKVNVIDVQQSDKPGRLPKVTHQILGDKDVQLHTSLGYLELEVRLDPSGVASMVASIVDQLIELFSGGEVEFVMEAGQGVGAGEDSASLQEGLLCALELTSKVECITRGMESVEATSICSGARIRATELIQRKVDAKLARNSGGVVDLAILQVVSNTLSAWCWAAEDEICTMVGELLGWCMMMRVWLRQAAAANTEVINKVLQNIHVSGWAHTVSHISEKIAAILEQAEVSVRDAALGKAASIALAGNCPELGKEWESCGCGSHQWQQRGVRISTLTGTVRINGQGYSAIPAALKKHSTFPELFPSGTPNECTLLDGSKHETVVKVWCRGSEYVVQACLVAQTGSAQTPRSSETDPSEILYDGQLWAPAVAVDSVGMHLDRELLAWFAPASLNERLIQSSAGWLLLRLSSDTLWHVYQLVERAGEVHEVAIFTSNDRWCSSALPLPLADTSIDHFPVGEYLGSPCELSRNMRAADACPAEEWDLVAFRRRGKLWDQHAPSWKLRSLLPAALVDAYTFWHVDGTEELLGESNTSAATVKVDLGAGMVTRTAQGVEACLLSIADADTDTPWGKLAEILTLTESLGQVLVWGDQSGPELRPVLVELPRLRTELRPCTDHAGITQLYLKEDPALFLDGVCWGCEQQSLRPTQFLPWQLLFTDGKRESRSVLLVPNVRPCRRGKHPAIRCLDYDGGGKRRSDAVARPFYLYTVVDQEVLPSSTAAALYLFTLRLHQAEYEKAAALVHRCASSIEYTEEDVWAASLVATTGTDRHPSAAACRLSIFEALLQSNPETSGNTQIAWDVRDDAWRCLQGHMRVAGPCLVDAEAERIALEGVRNKSAIKHGIHRRFPTPSLEEAPEPLGRAMHLVHTRLRMLSGTPESALPAPISWSAGGGWRRLEHGLAAALRECLSDFTKDGDCWQDKLDAPVVASARDGSSLSVLYDAILTPGPSAAAPAAFLSLCATRSGDLPVGLLSDGQSNTETGGACFVDLSARWIYLISQSIQEQPPVKSVAFASTIANHGGGNVAETNVRKEWEAKEIASLHGRTRSRTPWPRECILLLCALSSIPKPIYPPAKTLLGAFSLKALASRKKGANFNWAWAFMHKAFEAVSTDTWARHCAPADQRLSWGSQSSGGYGAATIIKRKFAATDTLGSERRCTGTVSRHPLCEALALWVPAEAKPPSPSSQGDLARLPFKLDTSHPDMATVEAADKLVRLGRSLSQYRKSSRLETVPSVFQHPLASEEGRGVASAHLEQLVSFLEQLRGSGVEEYIETLASLRACDDARHDGDDAEALGRKLVSLAGIAPSLGFGQVALALASSQGESDLAAAFPGVDVDAALHLAGQALLLHSRRLQINRALSQALTLRSMLRSEAVDAVEVGQVAAKLTEELRSQVYHARKISGGLVFDPRMMLFEHCASVILRQQQVTLLREISGQVRGGDSRVHQMIMGQGKTTVITPMLVLMFASQFLMTVTVPSALLAMARGCLMVLAKLQKRSFTVAFSRNCPDGVDPVARACALRAVLERARATESAVLSTPQTLKSVILHFIEMQAKLCSGLPLGDDLLDQESTDVAKVFTPEVAFRKICDELRQCLTMWNRGLLIIDEADVIFHPLRSELNFPVGQ